jgi:hypothetical protein
LCGQWLESRLLVLLFPVQLCSWGESSPSSRLSEDAGHQETEASSPDLAGGVPAMGFTVNDRANVVLYTMSGAVAVTAMMTIIYTIFSSVLRLRWGY